mmetsp:Transcript_22859/g.73332  ORF Transcript_22859/g.73332 Transcript_22859/m.73332 type:complete len:97 (+) Transcript_22859:702-992(+)
MSSGASPRRAEMSDFWDRARREGTRREGTLERGRGRPVRDFGREVVLPPSDSGRLVMERGAVRDGGRLRLLLLWPMAELVAVEEAVSDWRLEAAET